MIITQEQQENVREVLWHNLKFRETFDELYDHILTSIEHAEEDKLPLEIAADIIKNEFGGWDKLRELEVSRQKQIQSQLRGKLWQLMKGYFRFPLIVFTLLASGSFYYAAGHLPRKIIMMVLIGTVMVPFIMWCRTVLKSRWSRQYKASIKEDSADRIGSFGFGLFNCFIFIPKLFTNTDYIIINHVHASVLAVLAVVYITYSLSAIKIFSGRFKHVFDIMILSRTDLRQIEEFISKRGFTELDLQMEIIDHVACRVEALMSADGKLDLQKAIHLTHAEFGIMDLAYLKTVCEPFCKSVTGRYLKSILNRHSTGR